MRSDNVKVTLSVEDHVTPVLRGIRREVWLIEHGRAALALLSAGWAIFGFLAGMIVAGGVVR